MKYKIICSECSEIIGFIEKNELTEQDKQLYKESSQCSKEHQGAVKIVEDSNS